jgi:hypothetical protein
MQRGEGGLGGGPIACVKKSNDQWHAMCSEEADDRRHTEEARRGGRRCGWTMRSAVEGRRGTDDVVGSTVSTLQGFFWGVRSGEAVGGHIVCEVDPTTKTVSFTFVGRRFVRYSLNAVLPSR